MLDHKLNLCRNWLSILMQESHHRDLRSNVPFKEPRAPREMFSASISFAHVTSATSVYFYTP